MQKEYCPHCSETLTDVEGVIYCLICLREFSQSTKEVLVEVETDIYHQ